MDESSNRDETAAPSGEATALDEALERLGQKFGFFRTLGRDHRAVYMEADEDVLDDDQSTLFVSFVQTQEDDASIADVCPLGNHLRKSRGWAQLCVLAGSESWFRAPEVYAFFDGLTDDGFFEGFDRVVFFGERMGGYAAAAYSVAAPGAVVIACSPQATLTGSLAGWDGRYREARRLDFTSRYGYAPEMADAAREVFVFFDPYERLDAIHAALFKSDHTRMMPLRLQGPNTGAEMEVAGILDETVVAAAEGRLSAPVFYTMFRRRRTVRRYLRRLLAETDQRERTYLTAMAARAILTYMVGPQLKEAYKTASLKLEKEGRSLPPMIEPPRKAAQA